MESKCSKRSQGVESERNLSKSLRRLKKMLTPWSMGHGSGPSGNQGLQSEGCFSMCFPKEQSLGKAK